MDIDNLKRDYDYNLKVDEQYISTLPDLQNGPSSNIKGSHVGIEHVGIHNFKLPLSIKTKSGEELLLETSVTGTVSLEAEKKGINMSRILRSFYEYKDDKFTMSKLEEVLESYKEKLGAFDAHIYMDFSYPVIMQSLRSNLEGYKFYNVTLEGNLDKKGKFKKYIHLDFVYSSTCPCSTELSLHAMKYRNTYATPHSQRSIARITVQFDDIIWIEDIIDAAREALKTEVQILVKREDEQSFAELNSANVKFVEDAVRLVYEQLNKNDKILDFKVICTHMESLHPSDAIAVISKGIDNGLTADFTRADLHDMILKSMM